MNFDEGAADPDGSWGDGVSGRKCVEEFADDGGWFASEDGIFGSAHAGITEEGGAVGENFFIGGLDVGMGADECGDASIEESGHGNFFAGGFGVKVHEDDGSFGAEFFDLVEC